MTPDLRDATGPPPPGSAAARPGTATARRAPAQETQRLYALDWKAFVAWCQAACVTDLPAAPATVAAFLAAAAAGNCGASALGRRAAAIAQYHRQAGFAAPTADPAVRAILRQARRTATPRRRPPPRPAQLLRMAAACPGDLAGMRDRALLALAAAGLGRAALVGLDAEHVRLTATAADLAIRQAGPDGAITRTLAIPRGADRTTCPVQALRAWLESSETRFGPVFRKIDRWGAIEQRRLGTDALRRILARRTPRRIRRTRQAAAAA